LHAPAQTYVDPLHTLPSFSTTRPALVDLATHTAGFPSDPRGVGTHGYSLDAMYGYLDLYALAVCPGTLWNYSNLGYGLLADLVRRVSGATDYAAQLSALKHRTGLLLSDTVLDLNAEQQGRFATGFAAAGVPAPVRTPTWPAFNGSGALYSTAADVLAWARFMLGVPRTPLDPIRPLITTVYFRSSEHNMGLAWDRQPITGDATYWFKLGNTAGFSCFLAFSPELRCAVTVLSNSGWILWLQLGIEMLKTIATAA
jgi:CubicO group peptidase (beta-lactamase class C family)